MADVLPIDMPIDIILVDVFCRLMLCLLSIGLLLCPLADVIVILYNHRRLRADVIALDWLWLMLLPSGRWNGHRVNHIVCDRQML